MRGSGSNCGCTRTRAPSLRIVPKQSPRIDLQSPAFGSTISRSTTHDGGLHLRRRAPLRGRSRVDRGSTRHRAKNSARSEAILDIVGRLLTDCREPEQLFLGQRIVGAFGKLPVLRRLAAKVIVIFHPDLPCAGRLLQMSFFVPRLFLLRVSQPQIAQSPVRQLEGPVANPHVDAVVEEQQVLGLFDFLGFSSGENGLRTRRQEAPWGVLPNSWNPAAITLSCVNRGAALNVSTNCESSKPFRTRALVAANIASARVLA